MRRFILASAFLAVTAVPVLAAIPADPVTQTAASESRDDGAEYVWRVFCNSGLKYSYIPASQFPVSQRFEEVKAPQTGDIAWWPEFVAIYVSQTQSLITPEGMIKIAALEGDGSRPHFYRMRVLPGEDTMQKPAPGECERNLL